MAEDSQWCPEGRLLKLLLAERHGSRPVVPIYRATVAPMTCGDEARAAAKSKTGMWIHRVDEIIKHHNEEVKDGRACRTCGKDAPLIWG